MLSTMYVASVFVFLFLFSTYSAALVKWLPTTNFKLSSNFKDGKTPCSKQSLVFDERLISSVVIEDDVHVGEIILPKDGEMSLENGMITIGEINDNCTESGYVYYVQRSLSWLQPDVWSSPKFNEATPDAERIPCYDDVVEFPRKSQFVINLPDQTQYISGLILLGVSFNTQSFRVFARYEVSQIQKFIMNSVEDSGIIIREKACNSKAGCSCQDHQNIIDCTVKFCPRPVCFDPIKPIGHCCHICGGFLTIGINENFDINAFNETVAKTVSTYGEDRVVYHIGRLPDSKVQLVVVDKGEYEGTSAQIVHAIEGLSNTHGAFDVSARISGSPLSMTGMGVKIAVSMFFGVILVMGLIYAYYYKIPEIRYPIMIRRGGPGVLSRFNRRTDSVVSLTRRDSGITIGTGTSTGTAFRNPLYDSKRGRVQVAETVTEE